MRMKVLVIGSGGREHVLVWKLAQSPKVDKIFCAPGNAGISQLAQCVSINPEDIQGLLKFSKDNKIDITIVGPEAPLVMGIVDMFEKEGVRIFGPSAQAAQLEGSKAFSKDFMKSHEIPTAGYETFTDHCKALEYLEKKGAPIVIKADGLAAGKGAIVCQDLDAARQALNDIMVAKVFKDAGDKVVIEEFLAGEEASVLAFTDSTTIIPMESAQDHKRAYDNDQGPNTGGMGAYSPAPIVDAKMSRRILKEILVPTIKGMAQEGRPYKGVLYAGLMITKDGPKVVEFNCRFGDPETQVVLPRLNTDLIDVIDACISGTLNDIKLDWKKESAVCVVMASGGYPGSYEKNKSISGLDTWSDTEELLLFHAGTRSVAPGNIVTSGGRVLGLTALGKDIGAAISKAYNAIGRIGFEGAFYRRDIGHRALSRGKK
jgi:phosphoribosylamine--glycine ligase